MSDRKFRNKNIILLRKYSTIIVGCVLMALSINLIYEPMGLVTGGVSGLGIVVKKITEPFLEGGVPIWLFTVMCNVPLALFAIKSKGFRYILSVVFGTVVFIVALMIIPINQVPFDDYLLGAICGGALGGTGIGLVFSASGSTGGTDLLATLIHDRNKHISIPIILTFVDTIIVLIGALVFGLGNALYAIIAIFINAKVSDGMLEGLKFAKMAYIISDEYEAIASAVMTSLDRGVTALNAKGMYSNQDRRMLFCVVSKKEIVKIIEISKKIDPKSFVIISDVREVMGEGFIEYRQ